MASQINPLTPTLAGAAVADGAAGAVKPDTADQTVNKETFLRLLVAQIRNQNPLSPADGVQFLTQLAQFSELEQLISIRQDLEAIRKSAEAAGAGQTPADGITGSQGK